MGDWIEGNVGDEGHQVAIGRNLRQTTIQKETSLWRELVRKDLDILRGYVMGLLFAIMILFALGFVVTGLSIRQFDILWQKIERLERRIPYGPPEYYYPGIPLP